MKKSDLKPGMRVRNKVSGSIAEVQGDKRGKLLGGNPEYVMVRFRTKTGRTIGRLQYPFWFIDNLEIVD